MRSEMATYQQGHKSQTYENVETPKDVGAYIFTVAIVNRFFFYRSVCPCEEY